jgi:TonB family protein
MHYTLLILLLFSGTAFTQAEVIDFPGTDAQYPGGTDSLMRYIQRTVIYPDSAMFLNQSGKVYAQFIIEADGAISEIAIARSSGSKHLDSEALRVIGSMPNWIPGSAKNVNVRTRCRLPITFTMDNGNEEDEAPEKKKWWQRKH